MVARTGNIATLHEEPRGAATWVGKRDRNKVGGTRPPVLASSVLLDGDGDAEA